MSMARATRRSGLVFLLLGMIGGVFFWATDPRWGPQVHRLPIGPLDWRRWLFGLRGASDKVIDAVNQTMIRTVVGMMGSLALVVVGLWLLTRRSSSA
jgi:hypothetical protein